MKNSRFLRQKRDEIESCVSLREELGDDETIPRSFSVETGDPVNIQTNVYPITETIPESGIFEYSVSFSPQISNPKIATHLLYNSICPDGGKMSENNRWHSVLFDGNDTFFSLIEGLEGEFTVNENKVSIKLVHKVDDNKSIIRLYSIIFHRAFNNVGLMPFKRKWLNDQDIQNYAGFKVIGGFVTAIKVLSNGFSFIADTTSRVDRQGNLYDYLKRGVSSHNERIDLFEGLRDMQILTTHTKENKLIKISSVDWSMDPSQAMFEYNNKKTNTSSKISVAEYFQKVYNFTVQPDDPIIETIVVPNEATGEMRTDMYPASCLKVTGLTEVEKKDYRFMKGLREITDGTAASRRKKLDLFVSRLRSTTHSIQSLESESLLAKWGIGISRSLQVQGHVLDTPYMTFRTRHTDHRETEFPISEKMSFKNDLKNVGVAVPPRLNAIPIILTPAIYSNDIKSKFIPKLLEVANELGILIQAPDIVELETVTTAAYKREIVDYILKKGTPSFIFVVLSDPAENTENNNVSPSAIKERYELIKLFLTVNIGIPSQFMRPSTIYESSSDVISNILFQVTAKTGGVCYYVSNTKSLKLKSTMVIGISVSKKRSSSKKGNIVAMTASYDQTFGRYFSHTYTMSDNNNSLNTIIPAEFINEFIKKSVDRYIKARTTPPKRIVVYRDSVSYGVMKKVKEQEVKAIINALDPSLNISIIFCIVKKKSQVKFINEKGNVPKPGTIVTEKINSVDIPEFYLMSHDASLGGGVASPTRYTIIHHFPVVWSDEHFAKLTHYLTCEYPNWPGSLNVPCPLMLSSKLAEITRTKYGSQNPSDNLEDYLHYI